MKSGIKLGGTFHVDAYDKKGRYKWSNVAKNMVMKVGIQNMLNATFAGATQINPWYVGLLSDTVVTNDRTMANIALATEFTGDRPEYVDVRSSETITNAAGKATLTCDKDATTVEGAFLASSDDMDGSAGVLLCAGVFSGGVKVADSGDKLVVTYTFSGQDDGV